MPLFMKVLRKDGRTMNDERLLSLDQEDLYLQLGKELSSEVQFGEVNIEELRNRGKRWMKKQRKQLQKQICKSEIAISVMKGERKWDQLLLTAAIADLIAALVVNVSPVTVAALITKEGLHLFCED